jgi:cytochrome c oxidase subunit 2
MSDTAIGITVGYTLLSILGVAIGLIVFRSTRVGFRTQVVTLETLEKREGYWGVAVIAFLVVLLGGTIVQIPYWSDNGDDDAPQHIDVVGRQFAWTVNPPRVRAHVKTKIVVHTPDVNHGLGIYDPDGALIKQVNVLPGVTQEVVVTFGDVGTYKLRCLEFCGVDHHLMENNLEVTR